MKRSCDECKLCCTLLRIEELNKPEGIRCSNECQTGCSIYNNRPEECRSYECLWLRGGMKTDERPDKIGCVIDINHNYLPVIREGFSGAANNPVVQQFIVKNLISDIPVTIVHPEGLELITPKNSRGHVDDIGRVSVDYFPSERGLLAQRKAKEFYSGKLIVIDLKKRS